MRVDSKKSAASNTSEEFFDAIDMSERTSIQQIHGDESLFKSFAEPLGQDLYGVICIMKEKKFKQGFWNEFKITNWRKKEYGKQLLKISQKCLSSEYMLDLSKLNQEDTLVLKHIFEANQVQDLQNWIGIIIKRRIEKEIQDEILAKQQKEKEGGFFSFFTKKKASKAKDASEEEKKEEASIEEDIVFSEEELQKIQISIQSILAETASEEGKDLTLSQSEKAKQVRFNADFIFQKGRINLADDTFRVELYQDDLNVKFNFRRDTTFDAIISNQSVGLNVVDLENNVLKEIVLKQTGVKSRKSSLIPEMEESKKDIEVLENKQWQIQIVKEGDIEKGFMTDITFESNPIKLKYDAVAISKMVKFFKTGTSEELRAKAYDKISALKDSTTSSLKDLLYKRSNNVTVKIASPILELPFKAHNSEILGELESQRDRLFVVNLGNIDFISYHEDSFNKQEQQLDEYERFKLAIDSIGLKYVKHGRSFNVLNEVELMLDIGIKNKIKAALIEGRDALKSQNIGQPRSGSIGKFSPEVVVNAQLPELVINATPDVYNALVNLKQVLSSEREDEQLQQLYSEKAQIIKNSSYHNEEVLTRGIKGSITSYWQNNFLIISGSYIYFYKTRRDLMPHHYIYMGDCQISSMVELKEIQEIQNKQTDFNQALLLKQRNGEILYLQFNSAEETQQFMEIVVKLQQEIQGQINILKKQDILSDLIHKDQKEVGFSMTLDVGKVGMRIWQSFNEAVEDQMTRSFDNQWLMAAIDEVKFNIHKYQYEIKLNFCLGKIQISETQKLQQDILINEQGQELCNIDIDIYDIYSPNLNDAEIIIKVDLGKILWMYEPITINQLFKFFRNTKSSKVSELESINAKLMDQSELLIKNIASEEQRRGSQKNNQRHETCKTVQLILVKVTVQAKGVSLIAIHHEYFTPFFELSVGSLTFKYDMFYDHDIMSGDFDNARVFDLTGYPFTDDPRKTSKASLHNYDKFQRFEVLGIREKKEKLPSDFFHDQILQNGNGIHFSTTLYTDNCPLHPQGITSHLIVEIASIKLFYFQEQFFRILDYFMDKLIWAMTESNPYLNTQNLIKEKEEMLEIEKMSISDIEKLDMKQEKNTMIMDFKIKRPYLILKDRPHLNRNLELDMGELTLSYNEYMVNGRFQKAPNKELLISKFIMDFQDLCIKLSDDDFEVAPSFKLRLDFAYISNTPLLRKIDSHELDKSFLIQLDFNQKFHLRLREDIYTFILRCLDLNLGYTDNFDQQFNFKNDEEYFKTQDYLLKNSTNIRMENLVLSLFTKTGEPLTELLMRSPEIKIDYHLNRQHNYNITIEDMSSFFIQGLTSQKLLLFGNLNETHLIDNFEDFSSGGLGSPSKKMLLKPRSQGVSNLPVINLEQAQKQKNVSIKIMMYPTGKKDFKIQIDSLKLFLHPYFYLMLDHFFRENMPVYDMKSKDKPNEYNEDFEEYPEMQMIFKLGDSLVCLADPESFGQEQTYGIACQTSLDFEFKREKIKGIKETLWDKIQSISAFDERSEAPQQLPISWSSTYIRQMSPYICNIQELESESFNDIRKRQIIQPFNVRFHFANFLQYRPKENKVFLYQKSEIKKDKIIIKISYQDCQLLSQIFSEFTKGYNKFSEFYVCYQKLKKRSPERIKELSLTEQLQMMQFEESKNQKKESGSNSLFQKTQNAINIFRSMSISAGGNSSKNSHIEGGPSKADLAQQQMIMNEFMVPDESNYIAKIGTDPKSLFLFQKVDYESDPSFLLSKILSEGVQVVLINDNNNIFYPVLTVNLADFQYKTIGEFGHHNGNCLFKAMVSYYNPNASEWEPLIEKVKIEYRSNHFKGQIFNLISFRNEFNINITTQFIQTMIQTHLSLQKSQEEKQLQSQTTSRESQNLRASRKTQKYAFNQKNIINNDQSLNRGTLNNHNVSQQRMMEQEQNHRSQLEYKVTPYTIVNYSSRTIRVRSVFYTNGNKLKEYVIPPGEKVDYEVDYEEEVKHLMEETNEDVVKKQDFLSIMFEGTNQNIKSVNLRNQNFYHHILNYKMQTDYVAYGVKFENMRKILIIRAPFVFNNLTDVNYKMRLLKIDGKTLIKTVTLVPGQCYPIDVKELEYKFQLSNDFTQDEWSSAIKIKTIVDKVPKNATTYLYHGNQFTIITKEKSECQKNYNINFKTPVMIRNALPCNLRIRSDIIVGKAQTQTASRQTSVSNNEEEFEYGQREFLIQKGQSLKLHNYNLKTAVEFFFNLDTNMHQNLELIENTQGEDAEISELQPSFQWAEFSAVGQEFKGEKAFLLKDYDNPQCPPLQVFANMRRSQAAGVLITFYVKNVIINNTDQRLTMYYQKYMQLPIAGQTSSIDNSVILLNDQLKVVACIEDLELQKAYSAPFNVDIAAVTNTIQIRRKDQVNFHEFTIKTELSRACNDGDLFTKVTTISPCFVLHNKTRKTILITQEDCLDQCQILLSGKRTPFFWKDYRKPRLVKIKCVEKEGAEFDDQSHDWTFSFSLNEIGRMTIINRHKRSLNRSKHLRVDKQQQEDNQILFITFNEETPEYATYRIENLSQHVHIEYYQKDYPHNTAILLPEQNSIFSWTNPSNTEYKITCKFFGSGTTDSGGQLAPIVVDNNTCRIDIEPDNLELNERIELPQHLQNGRKKKYLFVYTLTNGYSKIIVFSDYSQEVQMRKKYQQIDEELKEGDIIQIKTFKVEMFSFGLSLICKNYKDRRKEFAFIFLEDLKFIVLDADRKREVQLKIGYAQIDNNIAHKPLYPVIMYPKELFMKRDKAIQKKKQSSNQDVVDIKEFFNMHFTTRLDDPQVLFFEEIDFLVQTIVVQMDDEFIGYIYRFSSDITDNLETNLTGVHSIFHQHQIQDQINEEIQDVQSMLDQEVLVRDSQKNSEGILGESKRSPPKIGNLIKVENIEDSNQHNLSNLLENPDDMLDHFIKSGHQMSRKSRQVFTVRKTGDQMNQISHLEEEKRSENFQTMAFEQKSSNKYQLLSDREKMISPQKRASDRSVKRETLASNNSNFSVNTFSTQNSKSWLNYDVQTQNKRMLYINKYKSSPLDIELSYVTKAKTDADDQANKKFSLKEKVMNFGLTLVNVDGANIRINSLILTNIFGTPNDIVFQLESHYIQRLKSNLFKIVGSSNILGNPANFVNHLGNGVQDFFYMPIEGAVKGPLEAGKGIVMGTSSLIKNTVQGTFGSASKVFSTMSKGLLLLSTDGEFINKREQKNTQDKPKNVIEGVGQGIKSAAVSVASGITGVVEKPVAGAKKEGFKGFLKGTYKGLSGLVVKPISGALDLFSKTSEGIKNTAGPQQKKVNKIRQMRAFYGRQQLIRAYNPLHGEVCYQLTKIDQSYLQLNFLDSILYNEVGLRKQKVIILTEEFFMIMDVGHRDIIMKYPSQKVMTAALNNDIITIFVANEQDDLIEGFKMKIEKEKALKRYYKIMQNFIYHVRTQMTYNSENLSTQR